MSKTKRVFNIICNIITMITLPIWFGSFVLIVFVIAVIRKESGPLGILNGEQNAIAGVIEEVFSGLPQKGVL